MDADITIIGAGVIGLAIAEELSSKYDNVFLIERHNTFGQETSSRNSEVIHAGIYYTRGSLKAALCVQGRELLYRFCEKYEIPHRNCGKLIVATNEEEVNIISDIRKKAAANGVDLVIIDKDRIAELEPNLSAIAALWSPTTGIVDSHSLMKQFETNTLNNGGNIAYKTAVKEIRKIPGGYEVSVTDPDNSEYCFSTGKIINSAGLGADLISEMAGMHDDELRIHFCKGEYFKIRSPKNKLVTRLVYPVPHPEMEGIGIHVTVDMGGGVKLGPDVKFLESNVYDYHLTPSKREAFWSSAARFLPFLQPEDIEPEMAGIRPKIQKPGDPQKDFYIREESRRGFQGFVNLIGMESPGLTSCMSIAKYVSNLIEN